MNSLTTVGGTVIDAAEMEKDEKTALQSAGGPRVAGRFGRRNVQRGRSVDEAYNPESSAASATADTVDEIIRPSSAKARAATTLNPVDLHRHRSAPATATAKRVVIVDDDHSTPRPRSHLNTRTATRFKNMDGRLGKKQLPLARADSMTTDETRHERNTPSRSDDRPSTIPQLSSSHHHDANKLSVLSILHEISKMAPYASSAYFRQLFTSGLRNVQMHDTREEGELSSVEDALRLCFDINEDMVRVIAAAGIAVVEKRSLEKLVMEEGRRQDMEDRSAGIVNSRISMPISSEAGQTRHSEIKLSAHQRHSRPHSLFVTPTDLSGYTQMKTPKSNPSHALSLPLPSTPALNSTSPRPTITFHFDEVMHNKPLPVVNTSLSHSELPNHPSSAPQEQMASPKVQQYLQQLEERIASVKKSHATRSSSGTPKSRPYPENPSTSIRPSDSVDEWSGKVEPSNKQVKTKEVKSQLFLPSLLSPGNEDIKDVGERPRKTSVSFGDIHDRDEMDLPLDESDGQRRQSLLRSTEDKVRAAEKSVGLKSLQEYRELLQERTMELVALEQKYQTQLKLAEHELKGQDEQVKQFRHAMKEAGVTVVALEETIQSLEAAVNEKDALIALLEGRVKSLETELMQSKATKLEEEIQHLDTVTMLNESISQMGMDIKEKETSLSELQAKTTELEEELSKVLNQLTASQTELTDAQKSIYEKDMKLQVSENELLSTKEMLHEHIELYKNEISQSLQNTTRLMDSMTKEKDSLIESLNAKIAMLEESLAEVEEEKEASGKSHEAKDKELNEKIKTLEVEISKKDEQIGMLQKEDKKSSRRRLAKSSYDHSRKINERLPSEHRRRNERRRRYVPSSDEEYHEPRYYKMHEGKHHFNPGIYYERSSVPMTREDREGYHSARYYERGSVPILHEYQEGYHSTPSPRRSKYYNSETRDDDEVSSIGDGWR